MQPPFKTSRRFIAGAVCPRCAVMDRIVVDLDTDQRECVACGFSDARPAGPAPSEPGTRVTRAVSRRAQTAAEAVTLIDPSFQGDAVGSSPSGPLTPASVPGEASEDPPE
ncbi:MAG: YheV family putative metal-binding protein [Chromatocurvus sp.]